MILDLPLHGITMELDDDDPGLSAQLKKYGTREGVVPFILDNLVQEGWLVIEIGGNQGFYATIEASNGATVHAIEPVPRNFNVLKRNLARYLGCKVYQMAAGNMEGTASFYEVEASNWGALADMQADSIIGETIEVKVTTLDSFVAMVGVPDLLRFDIEGGEKELLEAGSQTLAAMKPGSWILCELHVRSFGTNFALVPTIQTMLDAGFVPRYVVPYGGQVMPHPSEGFAEWFCETYKDQAPNVFLEKCA